MEISATNNIINSSIVPAAKNVEAKINAFGIGQANQPAVELSPQAQILQQTEQSLKSAVQSANSDDKQSKKDESDNAIAQEFVRVSSSIGKNSQSNALTSEQALDIYRSIEQYL
ncbi:hypothetical protein QX776_07080 [Alteromonadaceae bacterium BrNp21-10]|nr:hypothetical protein [Alteromonadaceae bacterium BrNp21-10]